MTSKTLMWVKAVGAAIVAVAAAIVVAFWRGIRLGKTEQRGTDREADVKRAGDNGDMEALDDYWRGKR